MTSEIFHVGLVRGNLCRGKVDDSLYSSIFSPVNLFVKSPFTFLLARLASSFGYCGEYRASHCPTIIVK